MSANRGRGTSAVAASLLLIGAAIAGCGGSGSSTPAPETPAARPTMTVEYAPGLSADVFLPAKRTHVPLVVLVPGGSWTTADPAGLAALGADLAERGVIAAPTHIRAAQDGVTYPAPVEDVLCAVAAVNESVRSRGFVPEHVAVLGHSSGAHLSALAVLATDDYEPTCSSPLVAPDALIGLSGTYDISQLPEVATALMGNLPDDDQAAWATANPVGRADLRPDVPVLLLHGEDDDVVPVAFTSQFAEALESAGHPTTVQILPDADHQTVYRADVAGEPVAEWLLALPPRAAGEQR